MGNSKNIPKDIKIDQDQWTKVGQTPMYEVMKSGAGEQTQIYHFLLDDKKDDQKQLQLYRDRVKPNPNLVNVKGIDEVHQGYGFCGDKRLFRVMTERVPKTLDETRQLSFPEAMTVFYHSLIGFKQIHSDYGVVDINGKLIGFTKNGQIKVWVHQNFGMNHPANEKPVKESSPEGERFMVENLIKVIQNKCENGQFKQPFRTNLYKQLNFKDAQQFIINNKILPQDRLTQNYINLGESQVPNNKPNDNKVSNQVTNQVSNNLPYNNPTYNSNPVYSNPNYYNYSNYNNQPFSSPNNRNTLGSNQRNTYDTNYKNIQPTISKSGNTRVSFNYLAPGQNIIGQPTSNR